MRIDSPPLNAESAIKSMLEYSDRNGRLHIERAAIALSASASKDSSARYAACWDSCGMSAVTDRASQELLTD